MKRHILAGMVFFSFTGAAAAQLTRTGVKKNDLGITKALGLKLAK